MSIVFNEDKKTFHLYNQEISYIMTVLPNGHMGQLYFGKKVHHREDYSYLYETVCRPMASCVFEGDRSFSLEHVKQEYGVYGTTDYRRPAIEILQPNGSRICDFKYQGYEIQKGKPALTGLPATYTENEDEAETLCITLADSLTGVVLELLYTVFAKGGIIARSARISNKGEEELHLTTAMSLCLDLPDCDYEWLQFSGAWARERHLKVRKLEQGIQAVDSRRGNSSHEHNPFIVLKRPAANEFQGEAIGFSLIYSGNFLAQAEVDTHDTTRVLMGIHPMGFDWKLEKGESFQTPEAVMVFSEQGLNGMSQTFHRLYQKRLARGYWRDKARPILNNNWEATYFNFDEDKLVSIAQAAKRDGVELAMTLGQTGLTITENGYGKRTDLDEYRITNRGGKGVKTINVTEKTGRLVSIQAVSDDNDLMIINRSGLTIRTAVSQIRVAGRATQGVRIINLREGDAIASVMAVPKSEEEEPQTDAVAAADAAGTTAEAADGGNAPAAEQ